MLTIFGPALRFAVRRPGVTETLVGIGDVLDSASGTDPLSDALRTDTAVACFCVGDATDPSPRFFASPTTGAGLAPALDRDLGPIREGELDPKPLVRAALSTGGPRLVLTCCIPVVYSRSSASSDNGDTCGATEDLGFGNGSCQRASVVVSSAQPRGALRTQQIRKLSNSCKRRW